MTTQSPTSAIDQALRSGRAQAALGEARRLCSERGATRETGIEIAKAAAAVYRDLIAPPVHEFAENAQAELPPEVGPLVAKALQRLINQTAEWEKKLWDLHTERLAREIRDWTRNRNLDGAAANIARLLALATPEQRARRAGYIGNVLATVINNQKEAAQVVALLARNPAKYQVDTGLVSAIDAARQKRSAEVGSFNLDNLEREFNSLLTATAVEIKATLPDSTHTGDPDEAQLRDCGDLFRAILRVPILRQQPDLFYDATLLLVEFVPREQTTTAKLARLEGRTYAGLGIAAKKAVQRTFMDIGQIKFFCTVYKGWAKDYVGTEAITPIVELMGALRSAEFNDYLKSVKASPGGAPAAVLNQALGTVAGEEAAEELMASLRSVLAKKRIESSDLREAERIVTSLGAIIKTPRTSDTERSRIWDYLRTHIPEDLTHLATTTAVQCFTTKHEQQTTAQLHWAIRALVRGIWQTDQTTVHHKGGERQASELGFREEIVQALIKIGPRDPECVAHAAEPLAIRFSAAFMAAAEAFEKINHPAFLPILERMLNTALLHDDRGQNVYQQEYYWDTATQERRPVTREKLIGPIVYAIGMIGGPQSQAILKRYQEQIAIGKVPNPTAEVAGFLAKFLGDKAFAAPTVAEEAASSPADPEELKELYKALQGWYLLTGSEQRRMKKIGALTRLARIGAPDSLDVVFSQLADKDPMVVSAAISCLTEFALPHQPKALKNLTIDMTLDKLESKDPAVRQGAIKTLKDIGPNRKDVRDKILAFAKQVERREVKEALAQVIRGGGGGTGGGTASGDQTAGSITGGGSSENVLAGSMGKLALKQQYLAARKAWIAGGKKGDPPPPPEGLE